VKPNGDTGLERSGQVMARHGHQPFQSIVSHVLLVASFLASSPAALTRPSSFAPSVSISMETREDIPRVSVGSVQDWQRVKAHYREAAMEELQKLLIGQHVGHEKDAIMMHLEQVCPYSSQLYHH
jgi:hypothetical protein